jgi:hypothetical protein
MAVSTYTNFKLLNAWQRIMGEEIFSFNQVTGTGVPRREGQPVYLQPARDDIARSLYEAVEAWVGYSLYYPRPTYVTERIDLRGGDPYQMQTLRLTWKHLVAFGSRGTTAIQAGAAVVYSDANGDGINDTATITVAAGSLTDTTEIQAFFTVSDGAPGAADERYEIEPLTVTLSGGNFILTGHRALFVEPNTIWDQPYDVDSGNYVAKNTADTQTAADFVTTVDVYRVSTDTTNAVQIVSDDYLTNCDCSATTSTQTAGGARIYDARQSIIQIRPSACGCSRPYEAVNVNYLAGLALVNNRVAPDIEKALVRLANCFMWQEPCSLYEEVKNKWADDRLPTRQELLQPGDAANPFGIKNGQIAAWRGLNRPSRTIGQGGKLTMNVR